MAKLNERRCQVAFMDSRATDLQKKIDVLNKGEYLGIREFKGATLRQLTRMAGRHSEKYPFDVVYIAGGVCDITSKDSFTNKISFEWEPPEGVIDHLKMTLNRASETMRKDHPATKVVFCPLVGVELARVVNAHPVTDDQQWAVDTSIFEFNENVFKLNKEGGTFSPSLHRSVHRSTKGTRKSYYHHLADGIHLSEELKVKWAEEFVKAAKIN